jgi:hypothetical protein
MKVMVWYFVNIVTTRILVMFIFRFAGTGRMVTFIDMLIDKPMYWVHVPMEILMVHCSEYNVEGWIDAYLC